MKKKKYEAPAMQVFELKAQQSLLAGSGPVLQGYDKKTGATTIFDDIEEYPE